MDAPPADRPVAKYPRLDNFARQLWTTFGAVLGGFMGAALGWSGLLFIGSYCVTLLLLYAIASRRVTFHRRSREDDSADG